MVASYSNRTGVREEKGHRVTCTHTLHVTWRHGHAAGRRAGHDGDRDRGNASTSLDPPGTAGNTRSQEKGMGQVVFDWLQWEWVLPTPSFQTSRLWNCKRLLFCCVEPPCLGDLLKTVLCNLQSPSCVSQPCCSPPGVPVGRQTRNEVCGDPHLQSRIRKLELRNANNN